MGQKNGFLRRRVDIWQGDLCFEGVYSGAKMLAEHLADIKNLKMNSMNMDSVKNLPVLKPLDWHRAPRIFRIYETEGDEIHSVHWNKFANFTFRQDDLR